MLMFVWHILYHIFQTTALQRKLSVIPLWVGGGLGTSRPTVAATAAGLRPPICRLLGWVVSFHGLVFTMQVVYDPAADGSATALIDRRSKYIKRVLSETGSPFLPPV